MQVSHVVFKFDDPVAFLNSQFQEKRRKDPRFSLRAWARQLGYENPSLLFHVLRGERRLKMDMALKMAVTLNLKGKALRYFELLVLKNVCQTENEKRMFQTMLAKLRPKKVNAMTELSEEVAVVAGDWYHFAILSMLELKDFSSDIAWIHERLGGEVDKKSIKQAVDRLIKLKLLEKGADGKLRSTHGENPYYMPNRVPSEAIRRYHAQVIEKAKVAVEQQTMDERILRGTFLAFKKEDMSKVSQIIADAHNKILALGVMSDADEIYQFNSQFFRLTKSKPERAH